MVLCLCLAIVLTSSAVTITFYFAKMSLGKTLNSILPNTNLIPFHLAIGPTPPIDTHPDKLFFLRSLNLAFEQEEAVM